MFVQSCIIGDLVQMYGHLGSFQVAEGKNEKFTISDVCLRIAEPHSSVRGRQFLPQFDCLLLSPANLWQNQKQVSKL